MHLREINDITKHHIVSGSEYLWTCYPDSHMLDYENEFANLSVVFNKKTQEIYEATICIETGPLRDSRPYRWLNPEFKEAYFKECKKRKVKKNIAWDDVKYIDLEVEGDFLEKAQAMFEGKPFDKRVQVPIDLDDDIMLALCMEAHKRDITLNQMVEEILRAVIDVHE
jgi:hypothetical protein